MLGYCKRRWVESLREEDGRLKTIVGWGVGSGVEEVLVQVQPSGQVCMEGRLAKCGVTGNREHLDKTFISRRRSRGQENGDQGDGKCVGVLGVWDCLGGWLTVVYSGGGDDEE
ncbi:hypothetical protein E2C01_084000 [Portunus trituberculatus]|uniref:Uncharacterized protein n=1 Tax=Portunus trituberculatus TaxID=210409 RepID=A0A5B7IU54_PORTR|nr:hypothetical protein [Portunus trituberculatus]